MHITTIDALSATGMECMYKIRMLKGYPMYKMFQSNVYNVKMMF